MPTTYAVPDGRTAMAATLYTGNGTTTGNTQVVSNAVNGVSFQPDFVWIKARNSSTPFHILNDNVRGANKILYSNSTDVENSVSNVFNSFNSNGFTAAYNSSFSQTVTNASGQTYVGWQWKAGGTAVTNTAGSITSTVSANTTTGFSIVKWTGTGSSGTTGHGLGVAPKFMILKDATNAYNWYVYTTATGSNLRFEGLNTTSAASSQPSQFTTTSTLIENIPGIVSLNTSGATMILYCWAEIAGFSKFGSYTGNGSADGPFVYLGFRPRFVMIKRTDTVGDWWMYDTSRSASNTANLVLYANSSAAEISDSNVDILSNGFKLRSATYQPNVSGGTFIYAAFAENPFKYANAR